MENVRRNGLSKKGSTRALVVLALAVAALLVAATAWLLWPKSNLGIDYSTEIYRDRQQKVIGPADYSEARIEAIPLIVRRFKRSSPCTAPRDWSKPRTAACDPGDVGRSRRIDGDKQEPAG